MVCFFQEEANATSIYKETCMVNKYFNDLRLKCLINTKAHREPGLSAIQWSHGVMYSAESAPS